MRRPEGVRTAAVVSLAVLLAMANVAEAKRGCSAFGHSCFGGHGKRMDPGLQGSAPEEAVYPGLRDVVFTAPRSDNLLDSLRRPVQGQDDVPQGLLQRQVDREINLQPFLRQWLQVYRNSQDVRPNNI